MGSDILGGWVFEVDVTRGLGIVPQYISPEHIANSWCIEDARILGNFLRNTEVLGLGRNTGCPTNIKVLEKKVHW